MILYQTWYLNLNLSFIQNCKCVQICAAAFAFWRAHFVSLWILYFVAIVYSMYIIPLVAANGHCCMLSCFCIVKTSLSVHPCIGLPIVHCIYWAPPQLSCICAFLFCYFATGIYSLVWMLWGLVICTVCLDAYLYFVAGRLNVPVYILMHTFLL